MTPIGKPPPNTFPYVDISDGLNSFWTLEHLSLKPVIISSRINKIYFFYKKSLKFCILNFHLLEDILVLVQKKRMIIVIFLLSISIVF